MSPRFSNSGVAKYIRLDDVILPITGFVIIFAIPRILAVAEAVIPFALLALFNLYVAVFVNVTEIIPSDLPIYFRFLPALKSIQYLIYFFLFYVTFKRLPDYKSFRRLFVAICVLIWPNLLYGFWQIITMRFAGKYAVGSLFESSPTLAGATYYFTAILSCVVLFAEQKQNKDAKINYLFWFVIFISSTMLAIATGSRAAALNVLLFIFLIWAQLRRYKLLIFSLGVAGLILFFLFVDTKKIFFPMFRILLLFEGLDSTDPNGRIGAWGRFLTWYQEHGAAHPLLFLTGGGSGATYLYYGTLANAADSQFISTSLSGGILGTMLYVFSLAWFYFKIAGDLKNAKSVLLPVFRSLFLSFMVFSASQEVFVLSKTGGLFWSIMGLLAGLAHNQDWQQHSIFPPNPQMQHLPRQLGETTGNIS